MSVIHVLPTEIVNQIAAGEVVERPAHLVKELLENSLDAGADRITIEIADGGRFIRVIDNGGGISPDELPLALQRHATSKIQKTDDLWNLSTFGFRGEALASAAAVSRLTLKSSLKDEPSAALIESHFGQLSPVKPSTKMVGTEILIESLFENVPARLKFLKSDSAEFQQIKTVVKAVALSHPEVEFKFILDGKLQFYYSKKNNRLDRTLDVLEKKNLFEARGVFESVQCHAVFSSPQDVAKTARQIWIFVQNRWVQDRAIQTAIMDAYRSLLMHGEYPFVALWLDCDPSMIDVNIHPTKSQIKFQDSSSIFRVVHHTLREALEKAPWMRAQTSGQSLQPSQILDLAQTEVARFSERSGANTNYENPNSQNLKFYDHRLEQTQFKSKNFNITDLGFLKVDEQEVAPHVFAQQTGSTFLWSSLQVIGQAHLTYIVCQKADRLVYVDQHAAHERVVFESLMASWKKKQFDIQEYLFPLALDMAEDQVEVLMKSSDSLSQLGFGIEQLGPQVIGVKSAPALIKDSSLPQVFQQMAVDLVQSGGSFAIEKKISDLFATMACHSVVRAGQSLSQEEMQELLRSMDQFPLSSFCPHGRPVSVEVTFKELEKLFGRIN